MAPDRAGGVAPGEDSPTQGPGTQVLPLQTGGRRSAQCVNIQSAGSPHGQPPRAAIACPGQRVGSAGTCPPPPQEQRWEEGHQQVQEGLELRPGGEADMAGAAGPSGLCVSTQMSASWAVALTPQRPSFTGLSWAVPRGVQKGSAGPRTAEGWAACDGVRAGHTGTRAVLVRGPSLGEAWGPREA